MAYTFQNISVLVIESSAALFALAKNVLTTFGVKQVYSAFDIQKGFDICRREKPDIVITDWLGDENGGLALIKQLRTDNRSPDPFVPVILMTGFTHEGRILAARDVGISEILVKPYTALSLYQKIEDLIERPKTFVRTSSGFLGPDRRNKRRGGGRAGGERRVREPVPVGKEPARGKITTWQAPS